MTTVTLSIASRDEVTRRALAAFEDRPQGARISFATADLLWRTLTLERWTLLQALTGQGAMSIPAAAQAVGRAVEAVGADVEALLNAGLLDREGEAVVFPYDAVHVDFMLTTAA